MHADPDHAIENSPTHAASWLWSSPLADDVVAMSSPAPNPNSPYVLPSSSVWSDWH